jgi:protoporphyrinogen oxidase
VKEKRPSLGILGGGLSGLSFAYYSGVQAEIFEKEERLGGLCRTFTHNGVPFDIGPHIFFSKDQAVLDFLVSLTPMHKLRRSNKIFYKDHFVKYPFENELSALPESDRDWCLNSFLVNPYDSYPAGSMLSFFYKTFGEGITRTYLEPYNRKIWKFEPSFMDTQMVDRIPKPPAEDIIASARGQSTEGYLHQLFFSYPDEGGTESVIRALTAKCQDHVVIHTRAPVEKVIRRSDGTFEIFSQGTSHHFERIVSTIPIHELMRILEPAPPPDVKDAVNNLKYNSIHITIVNVREDTLGNNFAVMVPRDDIAFHRVSKLDFLGNAYHRPETSTLMVEITYRHGDRYDLSDQAIRELVVRDLERVGFIRSKDVLSVSTRRFEYAYVIYDLNHRQNSDKAMAWLNASGITCIGRFSAFKYINMDTAVLLAKEAAQVFVNRNGSR